MPRSILLFLLGLLMAALLASGCGGPAQDDDPSSDGPDGVPALIPTRLPQRTIDQLIEVMHEHPAERDVVAARQEAIDRVFAPGGVNALYDLVSRKQTVDDRSLFGLTREERYLSENLRLVMIDIGSPRSLHALRPQMLATLPVSPMLVRAAARLDADDRQRGDRMSQLVPRLNQQIRGGLPTACARLLRELNLFLSPHPSRTIPLDVLPFSLPDPALTIDSRTRETLARSLADAFRELPGIAPAATIPGRRVRLALTPVLTIDALLLRVTDVDDQHIVWAGRRTWARSQEAGDASRRLSDSVGHTLQLVDAAGASIRDLPLVLHRAPPPSLHPEPPPPLGLAVMAFSATDEAVEITRAIREQILASLSQQRDFRVSDVAVISPIQPSNTRPEVDEPALALAREQEATLLITGSVQGRWVRGRFRGELVVRVVDPARDSAVVWETRPWDGIADATATADDQPPARRRGIE